MRSFTFRIGAVIHHGSGPRGPVPDGWLEIPMNRTTIALVALAVLLEVGIGGIASATATSSDDPTELEPEPVEIDEDEIDIVIIDVDEETVEIEGAPTNGTDMTATVSVEEE